MWPIINESKVLAHLLSRASYRLEFYLSFLEYESEQTGMIIILIIASCIRANTKVMRLISHFAWIDSTYLQPGEIAN